MSKPTIMTVDDNPQVLAAITRDLVNQYGADYRVLRAASGEEALATLPELKRRNETVALFLADQLVDQRFQLAGTPDVLLMHPFIHRPRLHSPLPNHGLTIVLVLARRV